MVGNRQTEWQLLAAALVKGCRSCARCIVFVVVVCMNYSSSSSSSVRGSRRRRCRRPVQLFVPGLENRRHHTRRGIDRGGVWVVEVWVRSEDGGTEGGGEGGDLRAERTEEGLPMSARRAGVEAKTKLKNRAGPSPQAVPSSRSAKRATEKMPHSKVEGRTRAAGALTSPGKLSA